MVLPYREHTGVKHDILAKYLGPWARILGKAHPCLCYFDGFAGPGRYNGKEGSPLIAIREAQQAPQHVRRVVCVNVEKDKSHYENLVGETASRRSADVEVVEALPSGVALEVRARARLLAEGARVCVINVRGSFAEAAAFLLASPDPWPPTFFFVDPLGPSGVPFDIVRTLLSLPHTEMMLTLMTQSALRCLGRAKDHPMLVTLFGTDECLRLADEFQLRDLYERQLKQTAAAKWVMPFRVMEERRRETLYYLMHASNYFLAFKIMKNIMWGEGAPGRFAFLGPGDRAIRKQLVLFPDEWLPEFNRWLLARFPPQRVTFGQLMEKSYDEHYMIEKHYRQALLALEREKKITVRRCGEKRRKGLRDDDLITFPG
jgi:three-Cys-motif partner protein